MATSAEIREALLRDGQDIDSDLNRLDKLEQTGGKLEELLEIRRSLMHNLLNEQTAVVTTLMKILNFEDQLWTARFQRIGRLRW
jgi:hypothetical protein